MFTRKPLPRMKGYVGKPLEPLDLNLFFDGTTKNLKFSAKLIDGSPLPLNIQCHENGMIDGVPAEDLDRIHYFHAIVTATNEHGESMVAPLVIEILLPDKKEFYTPNLQPSLNPMGKETSATTRQTEAEPEIKKQTDFADTMQKILEKQKDKE